MSRRTTARRIERGHKPAEPPDRPLPLRIAVALGDPERERTLLSALDAYPDILVAERCLSADQLQDTVQDRRVDAVLAVSGLHRLTDARLDALARTRIPIVLLTPDVDCARWASFLGIVLAPDADSALIHEALLAVARGGRLQAGPQRPDDVPDGNDRHVPAERAETPLSVMSVAGCPGSGRTTVALNLAAALGMVAPTVLVDLDLQAPTLAVCLDADPTRNLVMLAHAEPETPRDWDRAIGQEVQPLHPRSPHAVVLCGLPKPEMRSTVSPRFAERLIAELAVRYRYVLVDIGADLIGPDATVYGAALAGAEQTLLVCSPDLVGLWRTRTTLQLMHHRLRLDPDRIAFIINRYDRRCHHSRTEIEWALEVPVAAVIPHDHRAVQRALADQQPLVLAGRSRAERAFLELATRAYGGTVLPPPDQTFAKRRGRRTSWLRRPKVLPTIGKQ